MGIFSSNPKLINPNGLIADCLLHSKFVAIELLRYIMVSNSCNGITVAIIVNRLRWITTFSVRKLFIYFYGPSLYFVYFYGLKFIYMIYCVYMAYYNTRPDKLPFISENRRHS